MRDSAVIILLVLLITATFGIYVALIAVMFGTFNIPSAS